MNIRFINKYFLPVLFIKIGLEINLGHSAEKLLKRIPLQLIQKRSYGLIFSDSSPSWGRSRALSTPLKDLMDGKEKKSFTENGIFYYQANPQSWEVYLEFLKLQKVARESSTKVEVNKLFDGPYKVENLPDSEGKDFFTFENSGIKILFTPNAINGQHELGVYKLSEELLGLNIMPFTFPFTDKKGVSGVARLAFDKNDITHYFYRNSPRQAQAAIPSFNAMILLDYLLGNESRHGGNFLITTLNTDVWMRIIPIDHNNMYNRDNKGSETKLDFTNGDIVCTYRGIRTEFGIKNYTFRSHFSKIPEDVLKRILHELNSTKVQEILKDHFESSIIHNINERLELLRKMIIANKDKKASKILDWTNWGYNYLTNITNKFK